MVTSILYLLFIVTVNLSLYRGEINKNKTENFPEKLNAKIEDKVLVDNILTSKEYSNIQKKVKSLTKQSSKVDNEIYAEKLEEDFKSPNSDKRLDQKITDNTGNDAETEIHIYVKEKEKVINEKDTNYEINEHIMEGKVVGGQYTSIRDYPHSVFLVARCHPHDVASYWTCGSSVLNQRILLTAGHCVYNCRTRFQIDARAGSDDYYDSKVLRRVQKYIIHGDYDDVSVFADIALVYLKSDLPLGTTVKRVIIGPSFPINKEGLVAGWGAIDEMKTSTTKLKMVKQTVWSFGACAKHEDMQLGTFCASSGVKFNYPFIGDSGSALITKDFQQLGLVSYKCSFETEIIIYTNVSYYFPWIQQKSAALHCSS